MTSLLRSHTHSAPEHSAPAPENGVAPGMSPVLDIGGDVGAMIVYLDDATPSGEIVAQPPGRPEEHFHTGVHPRDMGGRTVHVALFPEVVAGGYDLLDPDGEPLARIGVTGGQVSELDLRKR
ncbi:MAG TPA: hypothetical protein VFH36_02405 [Acidimicrobiales bacterium]|jgi:hypothetical protein|nr:hypothetical protein [Acidimicrobiales bacterium]